MTTQQEKALVVEFLDGRIRNLEGDCAIHQESVETLECGLAKSRERLWRAEMTLTALRNVRAELAVDSPGEDAVPS